MSELIGTRDDAMKLRLHLLATVSAAIVLGSLSQSGTAFAGDNDSPQVWIELGGALNLSANDPGNFVAPYFATDEAAGLGSLVDLQKGAKRGFDENGKLTIQPAGSDWSFSAGVRYGRMNSKHNAHIQTPGQPIRYHLVTYYGPNYGTSIPKYVKFADTQASTQQTHLIADFQAGRDVGMGLFGRHGTATIDFGVRFAQFTSKSRFTNNSDPKLNFFPYVVSNYTRLGSLFNYKKYKSAYWARAENDSSFHGIGPSLSWHGSTPLVGHPDSAEIAVDWNVDGSLLFGRQKSKGVHQSSKAHCSGVFYQGVACNVGAPTVVHPAVPHDRSRSVTVPNIGGSLGLSFRSGDAKVNFGYRADIFFNAMDTGIDEYKSSNILFHGPYASISIGLGG
jgi:hypothetical protein